jgi:hypothetical protein
MSQFRVDAPVSLFVRIRQRRTGYRTPDAHVIELAALGSQAGFDISEALPVRDLSECHAEELIEASECFHLPVALIFGHATAKDRQRHELHDLCKNQFPDIHLHPPPESFW